LVRLLAADGDIARRLLRRVREALRQTNHYATEPRFCPGCGDEAVWTPIEPIDLGTSRPRQVETG